MGLGSGIGNSEKTYSGSPIQGSKRHQIPDPQQCILIYKKPKRNLLKLFKHINKKEPTIFEKVDGFAIK
jgi:hypothetical protein